MHRNLRRFRACTNKRVFQSVGQFRAVHDNRRVFNWAPTQITSLRLTAHFWGASYDANSRLTSILIPGIFGSQATLDEYDLVEQTHRKMCRADTQDVLSLCKNLFPFSKGSALLISHAGSFSTIGRTLCRACHAWNAQIQRRYRFRTSLHFKSFGIMFFVDLER